MPIFLSGTGRLGAGCRAKKYGNAAGTIASGQQCPKIAQNVRPNMQRNQTNGELQRMNPLGNMFRQGVHFSVLRIDPIFIIYSLGKSRPVVSGFEYVFIRVSNCNWSNNFIVVSVEVNQRHVLISQKLSFLYMFCHPQKTFSPKIRINPTWRSDILRICCGKSLK